MRYWQGSQRLQCLSDDRPSIGSVLSMRQERLSIFWIGTPGHRSSALRLACCRTFLHCADFTSLILVAPILQGGIPKIWHRSNRSWMQNDNAGNDIGLTFNPTSDGSSSGDAVPILAESAPKPSR